MRETVHSDSAIPTNQDSTLSQLSPVEIQESMATGLTNDLIPLGVTSDTLFEIQIKEIDADIARLKEELNHGIYSEVWPKNSKFRGYV